MLLIEIFMEKKRNEIINDNFDNLKWIKHTTFYLPNIFSVIDLVIR